MSVCRTFFQGKPSTPNGKILASSGLSKSLDLRKSKKLLLSIRRREKASREYHSFKRDKLLLGKVVISRKAAMRF